MKHIIIIEDDVALNNGIVLALKNENYTFRQYYSLREYPVGEPADLIILDINLPDGSGFDLLREIRRTSDIPVIVLTANDLETDEVTGLTLGADDYITKPFHLMVLRARIENVLRRSDRSAANRYGAFVRDIRKKIREAAESFAASRMSRSSSSGIPWKHRTCRGGAACRAKPDRVTRRICPHAMMLDQKVKSHSYRTEYCGLLAQRPSIYRAGMSEKRLLTSTSYHRPAAFIRPSARSRCTSTDHFLWSCGR